MKTYRCVRDCTYKINGRRVWREGMTTEVADDVVIISDCFEVVGAANPQPAEKDESMTFSGLQKAQKKLAKAQTGFAKGLEVSPDVPDVPKKKR